MSARVPGPKSSCVTTHKKFQTGAQASRDLCTEKELVFTSKSVNIGM